jgi:hypothetical protein
MSNQNGYWLCWTTIWTSAKTCPSVSHVPLGLGIGRDAKDSRMLSRIVELAERVRITREGVGCDDRNVKSERLLALLDHHLDKRKDMPKRITRSFGAYLRERSLRCPRAALGMRSRWLRPCFLVHFSTGAMQPPEWIARADLDCAEGLPRCHCADEQGY